MAERYLITKDTIPEGATVPEKLKQKFERNAALAEEKVKAAAAKHKYRKEQRSALKLRTLKYDKEYAEQERKLIALRRKAKVDGNFFVEPEAKLLFVIRIVGIIKISPKPRKVLQLLRLRQIHNGVFAAAAVGVAQRWRYPGLAPASNLQCASLPECVEVSWPRGGPSLADLLHAVRPHRVRELWPPDSGEQRWLEAGKVWFKSPGGSQSSERLWEMVRPARRPTGADGRPLLAVDAFTVVRRSGREPCAVLLLHYRPPVDAWVVELPAGMVEAGESRSSAMGNACLCASSVVPDPPSEQDIYSNLDASERKIWRIAFAKIDCQGAGVVGLDNELLRPYVMEASALQEEEDLEQALQRASKDSQLPFDKFEELLRKNASDETEALAQFQQLSYGEETIESVDARNALRLYGERKCGARGSNALDEDSWEKVLNVVMKDVEVNVDMEAWIKQSSLLARYVRALRQQKNPIL